MQIRFGLPARPAFRLHLRWLALIALVGGGWSAMATLPAAEDSAAATEAAKASETRLEEAAKYLASDELEGRGIGTKGLDLAADYLADQFQKLGLKTDLYEGKPFQKFKMSTGAKLGARNVLAVTGPEPKPIPKANPHDPHAGIDPHGDPHAGVPGAPPVKKDEPKKEEGAKEEPKKEEAKKEEPKPVIKTTDLKLGVDFNPMTLGGSGKFDLPLVFVGYGITDKKNSYDDYAGMDVKGKAVIILRKVPQQGNPHSPFGGDALRSEHAPFARKVSNAFQHEAAAVIFVNDAYDVEQTLDRYKKQVLDAVERLATADAAFKEIKEPSADERKSHEESREKIVADLSRLGKLLKDSRDPVIPFGFGGDAGEGRQLPVVHVRREVVDRLLRGALGKDLASVEKAIDKGPAPASAELKDCRLAGEISVERTEAEVKNVVAVMEGEGPFAHETIVIGAHYDHLGMGGEGSFVPGEKVVHNGADDNGSGTATLLEVARYLKDRSKGKPYPRRIVFIAFTGEERGLIGSARYVREPLFPLDKTVAMLNMDMVGRLTDDKLIVYGTGTAPEFGPLLDLVNDAYKFKITRQPEGFGPSDHSSFYAKKIPVFHFFTGTHKDYHRPSDDTDKLNIAGMRRVGSMVADIAEHLAVAPKPPTYVEVKSGPARIGGGGDRPYFGSIPDFSQEKPGYALMGVTKGGPAEKGGLKSGDIIVKLGDAKIGNLEDFDIALRKYKAGDKVTVTATRDDKDTKFEIVLDPPR